MQEQIYSLTVVHGREKNVSTEDVRDWLKKTLNGKVDRYVGPTAESFGGSIGGNVIECSLRILHSEDIMAETMKNYLADTPETFQITKVLKR